MSQTDRLCPFFSVCAHVTERFLTLFWCISMPELMSDDVTMMIKFLFWPVRR